MAEKTRFDKIFVKIKNNPALAVIIALGVIVMALSSFTNAARNLLSIFSKEKESANVTGTWKTQAITNQFNTKQKLNRLLIDQYITTRVISGFFYMISPSARTSNID